MEIIYFRRVCKTWKEAARVTTVPMQIPFFYGNGFRINTLARYNALRVMATELPNLQQFEIASLCDERYLSPLDGHKYSDGGDPDEEEAAETAHYTTHDIEIISNFRKLRHLEIMTSLNGRYHFLFNSFPLLQELCIRRCKNLKWDLDMLAGFP